MNPELVPDFEDPFYRQQRKQPKRKTDASMSSLKQMELPPDLDALRRALSERIARDAGRVKQLRRAQGLAKRWDAGDEEVTIQDIIDVLLGRRSDGD